MTEWERELYVSRIVSGKIRIKIHDEDFYLGSPNRDQKYTANIIYRDVFKNATLMGVMTQAEIDLFARRMRIWTDHLQSQYDKLKESVEEFKVGLYERWTESNARLSIRSHLKKGKEELIKLESIKHSYDHLSCEGLAQAAKFRFLIGCSLHYGNGCPYWNSDGDWKRADPCVELAIEQLINTRLGEAEYRELARNEPWRSLWSSKAHAADLFGVNAVDLSDEQRAIVLWSGIYDNIRESSECPSDEIIEDDDTLDGWMIIQRRKREASVLENRLGQIKNEKILNSDEVYLMVDTADDARKIEKLNNPAAQYIKKQRNNMIKNMGEISEFDMPDTALRLQTARTQAAVAHAKGK